MILHSAIDPIKLLLMIRNKEITLGGNYGLKIYGSLHCSSGKRLKKENRVFFSSTDEAEEMGYRPCGNCMKEAYKKWKHASV